LFLSDWRFRLGSAISLLFLGILIWQADLGGIKESLGQANYLYVVPAIALYFAAVYFRALRWRYLLSPLGSFAVTRLYPVVIIGYMANNLIPARLGELVRSYYLSRRERCSASAALATIAVERVYDGVTLLAFAAVAGSLLMLLGFFQGYGDISRTAAVPLAGAVAAIFAAGLAVLTLLAREQTSGRFIAFGLRFVPGAERKRKAADLFQAFIQGLAVLNSPRKHLALFVLSLPIWLLEASMYLLVGYSFGLDTFFPSFWSLILVVLLLTATSNLITSLPTAIGGIGPFELVAQQTLVALGVGPTLAGTYGVFLHLVALWLPVNLVGLGLLWWHNLSLGQLARQSLPSGQIQEPEDGISGYSSGTGALPQAGKETQ